MKSIKKKSIFYRHITIFSVAAIIFINYLLAIAPERNSDDTSALVNNKTMPPSLTLITVALGPIRGLIADALWWRVGELQDKGDFFEIIKITDWITAMQPKNSFVWTYHAWNLGYNIANEFPTSKTRWEWINNGIKLLRDEGLEYNPQSNYIKNELGWMLVDRVSGTSDVQYKHYVRYWVLDMEKYMTYGDRSEIKDMIALESQPILNDKKSSNKKETTELKDEKLRIFNLKKNMKLDPKRMVQIDKQYGPFNWLLPQASAVYWSAMENYKEYSQGYLNYKAVVPIAMQQAFLRGAIITNNSNTTFITTNNFEITANIINLYTSRALLSKYPRQENESMLRFARNAIPILYSFKQMDKALLLFKEYKRLRPDIKVDFKTFIYHQIKRFKQDAPGRYKQSTIEIYLYHAYNSLLKNDIKKSNSLFKIATEERDKHQVIFGSHPLALIPLEQLKIAAFCKAFIFAKKADKIKLLNIVEDPKVGKLYIKDLKNINYNNVPLNKL